MKYFKPLIRALLLMLLFLLGAALIWHIGHNVNQAPKENNLAMPVTEPPVSPVAPAAVPETANLKPDKGAVSFDGSPPIIIHTARGRFITSDPILFNSGLTTLREASLPRLDRIAAFLVQNPDISVEILGHTDNLGPETVNRKVSGERAAVVRDYLVSQGIDPSRLQPGGMGSADPIESNDTQLGRQANRRIEFLIREMTAVR
jgi:OmpA-OmpF porin, OOP family